MPIDHIRPQWQKVAAYLQSEARKSSGFAIISEIRILIDANGDPIMWTEIKLSKLMPKSECNAAIPKLLMIE